MYKLVHRNNKENSGKDKSAKQRGKIVTYLFLHSILLIYSLSAVCSKMAALSSFASIEFFLWYGGTLLLLVIYAFVWQRVLKYLPLTTAYANKGITIVWGILWGMLLFSETISVFMLIGAALVFTGILLVVTANE